MNTFLYPVSIKGVLRHENRYLLRLNERNEWELLGGKLETSDSSPEERLRTEFLEESGITIAIQKSVEPWIYTIGIRDILIVTYECSAIEIPDVLTDLDGGQLAWFTREEIEKLVIPRGYLSSIDNLPAVHSESATKRSQPPHVTVGYEAVVELRISNESNKILLNEKTGLLPFAALVGKTLPREAGQMLLSTLKLSAGDIAYDNVSVVNNKLVSIRFNVRTTSSSTPAFFCWAN